MHSLHGAGLSRRLFLRGTGGSLLVGPALAMSGPAFAQATGGTVDSSSRPPSRSTGRPFPEMEKEMPHEPGKRMGYAIVGLGQFALNQIIPSFAESKSSKLVALVSGNRQKAEQVADRYGVEHKNIYGYDDFDRIADNDGIDIVYIILPNALHAEYTVRAFKARKHVMCEKPMAPTIEECETMIRAGREANRKLMIAYRAQYEPYNLEAIRMAREGELGKIRLVTSDHGRILDPKVPADQWRMVKSLAGGGSLYDIGIYSLQAARYITGEEPLEVASAQISSDPADPRFTEVEDLVTFQLRFPCGVLANLSSSYSTSPVKRIQVFGSKASLVLDPATEYWRHQMMVKTEKEERRAQIPEGNQFANEMDHLVQAILESRDPKTPGEEGLRDVRIMQAVYRAAAEGKPVSLEATGSVKP